MRNQDWTDGWGDLESCCRDKAQTPAIAANRAKVYRRALDHLSPEEWRAAVDEGVKGWFPTIDELLNFAAAYRTTPAFLNRSRARQIEDSDAREAREIAGETIEQRQARIKAGLRLLDQVEAELRERGFDTPPVAHRMPPVEVEAQHALLQDTPARRAELKRQAEEIAR